MMNCVIPCAPHCAHFSVLELVVDAAVGFTPHSVLALWQYESARYVFVCMTYIMNHGGHALANSLVLLVSTCIPIFERCAPHLQLFL
jgi:hypothetical protein